MTPNKPELSKEEAQLIKILKLWAKRHGAPDSWEPKPLLVKWLMSWRKEGKMP